jgi:PAS domain S-box-containing protein
MKFKFFPTLNAPEREAGERFGSGLNGRPLLVVAAMFLAAYYLSGKLGLSLAFVHSNASAVWPPTGLALAGLLVFGRRLWPLVFLGAFLVNLTTAGSWATSIGIATGNTLEAVIGCWLVQRVARGLHAFEQAHTVLLYLLVGIVSTAISATVGVGTLCLGQLAAWQDFTGIWLTWWLGDFVSHMVIAPLLILWMTQPLRLQRRQMLEGAGLLLLTAAITTLILANPYLPRNKPIAYLSLPPLLWVAFRFGPHGATAAAFLLSAIAIQGTLRGLGTFATDNPNYSLMFLQSFVATSTTIALVLAATVRQQKAAACALKSSDERYRAFITQSSEGIWRFEFREPIPVAAAIDEQMERAMRSGYLAECNDAMARMYDFKRAEDIIGRALREFLPPSDPDNVAYVRSFIENGYRLTDAESSELNRHGQCVSFLNNLFGTVEDGHLVRVWGTQRDITERKRAETNLRESEERFRLLADSAPVLIWVNGPEGCQFVNRAYREFFGRPEKDLLGMGWAEFIHPDDREGYLAAYRESHARKAPFKVEVRFKRADGAVRWLLAAGLPRQLPSGELIGYVGSCTDITEIIEARETLAHHQADLEKIVTERTAKLRELVGELEAFSYSVSHDMRAPLRAMQGYAHLVLTEYGASLGADGSNWVKKINQAALRLDKLITDVLTYSRVVRAELKLEPVQAERLIRDLVEQYPEWHLPRAMVNVEPPIPAVLANEALLSQCVTNLVANATKFVTPGIVPHVHISSESATLNGRRAAKILFRDNGIGIAPQDQARIFKIFERVHGSEFDGTGIGLSIVRKAVERMDGRFGLESQVGKGSTFWIELQTGE